MTIWLFVLDSKERRGGDQMSVMLEEQETSISIMRTSDKAEIYTSDSTMIYRLDKKCKEYPDTWKCISIERSFGEIVAKVYSCPKKLVSLRNCVRTLSNSGNTEGLKRWRERQKQSGGDA